MVFAESITRKTKLYN